MASKDQPASGRSRGRAAAEPRGILDLEMLNQRLLVFGVGFVLLLVVGIIAFGYYQTKIAPKRKVILEVEGTKITRLHLSHRILNLLNTDPQAVYQAGTLLNAATTAYDGLKEDTLLIHGAARDYDVYISDAEIDQRVRTLQGVPSDADAATFASAFRRAVQQSELSVSEFRFKTRAEIARERVQQQFTTGVPASATQMRFRFFQLTSEGEAKTIAERIRSGEDVTVIVKEVLGEEATIDQVESTWMVKEQLANEYAEPGFALEFGAVSDPILAPDGATWVVLQQIGKEEREVDSYQKTQIASTLYQNWIADLETSLAVKEDIDDDDKTGALEDIQDDIKLPQAPAQSRRQLLPADAAFA